MKYPTTAARIRRAMEKANIKAQELAEATGIHKSSISQYVNGSHTPSIKNAAKMAEVLDVNTAWLKGYDVPMHKYPIELPKGQAEELSRITDLNMYYHKLSNYDQKRLVAYAEKLFALNRAEEELK